MRLCNQFFITICENLRPTHAVPTGIEKQTLAKVFKPGNNVFKVCLWSLHKYINCVISI